MIKEQKERDVNTLYTDFRSDVIAAGAVDNGFSDEQILILRRQSDAHDTDKEILDIEYKQDYEGSGEDMLVIKTNRLGMYDNLPEGLFHGSSSSKDRSKEAIIDSIRKQNKEEFFIRRFFSLYETEIERTRIDIQLTELHYDRPEKHRASIDTMSTLWPMMRQMDSQSAALFMRVVPYISEIRNSYAQIAKTIETVMGYRTHIKIENEKRSIAVNYPRLGAMRLGINSVLKGKVSEQRAVVTVEPSSPEEMDRLRPEGDRRLTVEALLEIMMPSGIDCRVVVRPRDEDYIGALGETKRKSYLGINTRLGSEKNS